MSQEQHIDEGQFYQSVLETHSGNPLHLEGVFLDHLAELVMQRYEGKPGEKTVVLPSAGAVNPLRTKRHYRRMFCFDESPVRITQDFITWASETLGLWIELSMKHTLYAEGGQPHASDPVYDVLSIALDSQKVPRLRVVQVKASKDNLQAQANKAINNFENLENGEFDPELSTRLELIERRGDAPPGIKTADLLFDMERHYRVTLVHNQDHTSFKILTTYHTKVLGSVERRSAHLIRAKDPEFWNALGKRVYAQLAR